MDEEETQFLLDDEEEKPAKKKTPTKYKEAGVETPGTQPGTDMSRVKVPKIGPTSRGGKGGKAGMGAKGEVDKNSDPAKPKKARSAYNFYLLKRIAQLKEEGVVELHRDRFAQAAGEWGEMTFGERIPYEDMARADKERHQKDLDIATRNLNAALVGSIQKHGQGMCSAIGFPGLKALAANSPHEDVCAVCKEEGDLLCCDFCTATYHLTCLNPPMLSLPSDDVQWACPVCSAKVKAAEMSAPQQKPKRDRKDGKKRQRTGSSAGTGASSPRAGADAGSFTIPKMAKVKGSKAVKEESGPRSPRVKREEREEVSAVLASSSSSTNKTRMVTAPLKASISPRVGLGLTDATDEESAMRYPDLSGSQNNDKSPSKAMMSLAVAAASVLASEAAIAAAVAAASEMPAPAPAPPKALGLKKLLHQRVQYDEANSNPAFSPKKLLKHRLLASQQVTSSEPVSSSALPSSNPSMGGGSSHDSGMDDASNTKYPGHGDGRGAKTSNDDGRYDGKDAGAGVGFVGIYPVDPKWNVGAYSGRGSRGYKERGRDGDLNGRMIGGGEERNRRHGGGTMNDAGDGRGYGNQRRGDVGGTAVGKLFHNGGVGRDRAGLNGEQRSRAEVGSGYDAGRNPALSPNGVYTGEASGGGWRGRSQERHGRLGRDGNASDKWSGGERSEMVDAARQHGFNSATHGQERSRGQELYSERRGSVEASSWKAAGGAGQRNAHGRQQNDSSSRGRADATPRQEGASDPHDSSAGRGFNKGSGFAPPPPPHSWDGGRNTWRPDRPSEGKRDLDGRPRPREAAGRVVANEGRDRPARSRGREDSADGGPHEPRSRSSGEQAGGGGLSRGQTPWVDDATRGGSSRVAGGAAADSGNRERGFSAGGGRAGNHHYNNGTGSVRQSAGGGQGRAPGGNGGGSLYDGWSERKRSLESADGRDVVRGSPKKHAPSPHTTDASRRDSRSRPGHWNAERPSSGGAGFSGRGSDGGGPPDSRERSRDSHAPGGLASREGRGIDDNARDHFAAAAAAGRARDGGNRRDDQAAVPWVGGGEGARFDRRDSGSGNLGGRAPEAVAWSKNNHNYSRNGPQGALSKAPEAERQNAGDGNGGGQAYQQRGGGGGRGRGHWKARLTSGRGGDFTPRGHPTNADRAREPSASAQGAGRDGGWQEPAGGARKNETGYGGDSSAGSRQAGRSDEPTMNGDGGGYRRGSQGRRGREWGDTAHPSASTYRSQARGLSVGPGATVGEDRRRREPTDFHDEKAAALNERGGGAGGGGGRGAGSRKDKNYSGFALPKPAPPNVSSAVSAASATSYAAFKGGPSSAETATRTTTTTSVSRPDRSVRSQEYEQGQQQQQQQQQQRSMARMNGGLGGRSGGEGFQSFHHRGASEMDSRGLKGIRQQQGDSGSSKDFLAIRNGGASASTGNNNRSARSRSPPSRSARRSSASPSGWQRGYKRHGSLDVYTPSGGRGGGADLYQKPGKPRPGWESAGRGVAGPGGPKPWKGRCEQHYNNSSKDGDRYDGRADGNNSSSTSSNRFQTPDNRRANFPARGQGGVFGGRGPGGRGRGWGRGRGRFDSRSNNRSNS